MTRSRWTMLAASLAAAALRAGAERHTGAAGETAVLAITAAVVAGIWPRLAPLVAVATPLAVAVGARRERMGAAARWSELRHGTAGDPAWISSR